MPDQLTILFADLAGSTRLYQREGDEEAHRLVIQSLSVMRDLVDGNGGAVLRTVGDAVLASFDRADDAYRASVAIQRAHQALTLSVRVGYHVGDVIPDAGDIYGNAVNLAARVASFAQEGEIFTTHDALAQMSVAHRADVEYIDDVDFKGIESPMAVYRVHWAGAGESTAIVTSLQPAERYSTGYVLELILAARRYRVDPEQTVLRVGRAFDNDIIVDNDSVSRHHARFELVRGRYLLQDTSTNGTYLLKSGHAREFIRRESSSLETFGLVGLGRKPDYQSPHAIEYRVVARH